MDNEIDRGEIIRKGAGNRVCEKEKERGDSERERAVESNAEILT